MAGATLPISPCTSHEHAVICLIDHPHLCLIVFNLAPYLSSVYWLFSCLAVVLLYLAEKEVWMAGFVASKPVYVVQH